MKRFALAVLAGALLALTPVVSATAAERTESSFQKVEGGPLTYWLKVPGGKVPKGGRPLVVYLHGCTQADEEQRDAATGFGTGWNELAEEPTTGNGGGCWNWFLPENQRRGSGEAKLIADITGSIIATQKVDGDRVYIMGVSAGADMTVVMGTTYPDLYRAMAPFAGCAYATCADLTGRLAYEAMGDRARVVPAMVVQGTADPLNNLAMAETLRQQLLGTADWVVGERVSRQPTTTERHGDPAPGQPSADPADACVRNSNWPCPAGVLGWESYPYTVEHYETPSGTTILDFWTIHGLSHNYPGSSRGATFTDPAGPDITRAAWEFFARM
jgi:poly(hydroxyalkanoate) depolymerase family esterase